VNEEEFDRDNANLLEAQVDDRYIHLVDSGLRKTSDQYFQYLTK
jgi:hypothetical protein